MATGLRRVVFEAARRRAVDYEPGVRVVGGAAVKGLLADGERVPGAPHVIGVRTDRDTIEADLVVDATGRRSPLPAWLAELDGQPPVDDAQDLRFAYHTRWYRAPYGGPAPLCLKEQRVRARIVKELRLRAGAAAGTALYGSGRRPPRPGSPIAGTGRALDGEVPAELAGERAGVGQAVPLLVRHACSVSWTVATLRA